MPKFISEDELVFIEAQAPFVKKYENGNEQTFRFVKFADPLTFENIQYLYSDRIVQAIQKFDRGEKVKIVLEAKTNFNRVNHEVIDVIPASVASK